MAVHKNLPITSAGISNGPGISGGSISGASITGQSGTVTTSHILTESSNFLNTESSNRLIV